MKQLQHLIKSGQNGASANLCAHEILDVIPLIMRAIRGEMRRHRTRHISVPQFRTLAFLAHFPKSALSPLAEHLGLTKPSASKLVDGLVAAELIKREASCDDRRQVCLSLTLRGKTVFDKARQAAQNQLASKLAALDESERQQVIESMHLLRQAFAADDIHNL